MAQSSIDWVINQQLPVLARYANYRFVLNTQKPENKKMIALKTLSPTEEDFLFNTLVTSRHNYNAILRNMQGSLIKADSLITDIQNDYHLE